MYCENRMIHTVQAGDSLYKLSRQYHTTVTELILGNPGVNPYNLQVGMRLMICPGPEYQIPVSGTNPGTGNEEMPENGETPAQKEEQMEGLIENMRLAWLNHVFWTRMYLMAVAADSGDKQATEERLLQTADEITDIFARYMPIQMTRQLRNLLLEHIEIGGEIINGLKSGNTENYDALIRDWYGNANQIAALLGAVNPYFSGRETRNMLLNHLDLTRQEIEYQLNGEYEKSIESFRDIEHQALEMADFFARGLMAR